MVAASKDYKRSMNNAISNYNNDLQKEILSTRSNNPREFWKIINNADSEKKPTKIEANLDDLFNHFKNVSNSNEYVHKIVTLTLNSMNKMYLIILPLNY